MVQSRRGRSGQNRIRTGKAAGRSVPQGGRSCKLVNCSGVSSACLFCPRDKSRWRLYAHELSLPRPAASPISQVRNLLQQARVILQTEAQGRPQTRSMPPGMPIPMPMAKPMPSPTPWGGLGAAGAAPSATIPTPFPAGPPVPSSALPSPYPLPNPGAGLVAAPTPQTSTALPDGLAAFLRPPPSGQQPDALGLFLSQHARRQLEEDLQDECCICLDRKQDMVFQPCQHRVCRFCGEKLFLEAVRLLCPMCRQVVQKRVPLCPEDRKTPARKPRPGR